MRLIQTESDAEVVRLTLAGNRHAFEALVGRYTRMAYAVAYARLGNREDAQDAVQEAWAQSFSSLDRLRNPEQFRSWFAAIVRNASINAARKRWRERPLEEARDQGMCEIQSQIEQNDLRQTLWAQLATLSPDHREVLGLFYYAGMTAEEIAVTSGQSREVIKKRIQRARAALDHQMLRNLYEPVDRDEDRLRKRVMALLLVLPVSWEHDAEEGPGASPGHTAEDSPTSAPMTATMRWILVVAFVFAVVLLASRLFLWYAPAPAENSAGVATQSPIAPPVSPKPSLGGSLAPPQNGKGTAVKGGK